MNLSFPFSSIRSSGWSCFLQVAGSAVGRWFKLDGSGAKRERQGSRFTVRFWDDLSYADAQFQPLLDRNSCRIDDMGAFRLFQYDEKLSWHALEQAAMAYIVSTSMMFERYNCIDNIPKDIRQRFHSLRLWRNLWMPDQRPLSLRRNVSTLCKWGPTGSYHVYGRHLSALNLPYGSSR